MSALGQKRTYAAHNGMSALPPIATAKADSRTKPCLLCPRKRTCAVQLGMSALGQKRTYGIAANSAKIPPLANNQRGNEVTTRRTMRATNVINASPRAHSKDSTSFEKDTKVI